MLNTAKKGLYVVADSLQSGFVNIYKDPNDSTTFLKKVVSGNIVGRLTGEVLTTKNGLKFVEVVYDERSLTNWIEDKGFVNMNLVSYNDSPKTAAYYSSADNVRVRATPALTDNSNVIAVVNKGKLIGYSDGTTIQGFIRLNSAIGTGTIYVKSEFVTKNKNTVTNTPTTPEGTPNTPPTNTETTERNFSVLGKTISLSNKSIIAYALAFTASFFLVTYIKKHYGK